LASSRGARGLHSPLRQNTPAIERSAEIIFFKRDVDFDGHKEDVTVYEYASSWRKNDADLAW
jgi:hypothetical protein